MRQQNLTNHDLRYVPGVEALSRNLSAELAAQGIRAICLRTTGSPKTKIIDVAFELQAKAMGVTREEFRCRLAVPDEI